MSKYFFMLSFFAASSAYAVSPEKAFVDLAKKVRASVVNISTTRKGMDQMIPIFPGYFMPFNLPEMTAAGSGFIVDKKGLIITNAHVAQNFDKIQVQFVGDTNFYSVKLLGADSQSDIALLKVSVDKKLVPIEFGDSSKLQVGEWVAAIGNPHGYGHTMTKGIISAVKREIDDLNLFPLLQTDASINPGNSGGPLVNLQGKVVGVNQAIIRGATGIGFAIPINNVKEVFEDLKSFGYVKKGFIGVEFYGDGQEGVVVTNVVRGSPAQKSGLKAQDRIIEFNSYKIKTPRDLPKAVRKTKVGKTVSLKAIRDSKPIQIKITPKMLKENSFASLQSSKTKEKIKGQAVSGGFRVAMASKTNLQLFNQPDLGAKNPLVVYVQPGAAAHKGGLRLGDLIFQVNGKRISKIMEVQKAVKKGENKLNVLRYHRRYDKYLLISISFAL